MEENEIKLQHERLAFDKVKWEREHAVSVEDLALRKRQEIRSTYANPLFIAVVVGVIGLFGNTFAVYWAGKANRELESQKAEGLWILEALKTGSPDSAAVNLENLSRVGLLTFYKGPIENYLRQRPAGEGLSLPAARAAEPAVSIAPAPDPQVPSVPRVTVDASPKGSGELEISRELQRLAKEGKYDVASDLFPRLRESHFSGVGYSAYPAAAFAYDQVKQPKEALNVLELLWQRMQQDESRGSGFLTNNRYPRSILLSDLEALIASGSVQDQDVRAKMTVIIAHLTAVP